MGVTDAPEYISNLLVHEPGFGPAGGGVPESVEQLFEGDDVMVTGISEHVKKQMKEQGLSNGREFAGILCLKEEDKNMLLLVWDKVLDKLTADGNVPTISITEETKTSKRTIVNPIILLNVNGTYNFGSKKASLCSLSTTGRIYEDKDYRDAYNAIVVAFTEEWKKIGKSPIDWGEYDSHKYEI